MIKQLQIKFDFEPETQVIDRKSYHCGLNYEIGANYIYPNDTQKKVFRLISVSGFIFHFEGGHKCTDNVFKGLTKLDN